MAALSGACSKYDYSDLEPVAQDDGPRPVVTIHYSSEFVELMDLFRALLKRGECSARGLALTEELIAQNPSNYTVWQYRRECLRAEGSDLHAELEYMDSFADTNPKNYQIWHHRRAVVQDLGDCSEEFDFTKEVFEVDAKNYHAWAHRQWACKTYGAWDSELPLLEQLLKDDVRNNSAWNHRWFVKHGGRCDVPRLSEEDCMQDIEYCFAALGSAPRNESPWNYLRGLLRMYSAMGKVPSGSDTRLYPALIHAVFARTLALVNEGCDLKSSARAPASTTPPASSNSSNNPFAVALLADLVEMARLGGSKASMEAAKRDALGYLTLLITIDSIRGKAWAKRARVLQRELAELSLL